MINPFGIGIIKDETLPAEFYNKKTNETEIVHMIRISDKIYVSEELFEAIEQEFNNGDVE